MGMSITEDASSLPPGIHAVASAEHMRARIEQMVAQDDAAAGMSILAGPLTTVTRHLVGVDARLVGLSWGWDLQPEAIGEVFDPQDLAWVSDLDALIVDSIVTQEVAIRLGLEPSRITNIPWGIDTELFTPEGPKADLSVWGVSPGARVILSLRSHTAIHRVGDVIEAFALALEVDPDLFLLVGGDGPLRGELEQRVETFGIESRVAFIGLLPEGELPPLLRAVDVYVSATAVDGTSVTLVQAVACGVPVITSNIAGGRPWYAQDSTATFDVGDVLVLSRLLVGHRDDLMSAASRLGHAREVRQRADWRLNSLVLSGILLGSLA